MQPYQESAKEIGRQGELPLNIAKGIATAGSTAATAYLGGSVINRVIPFLSKYIPENLAIKGLNKIDPRYGTFIQKALSDGKSFEEVKDFIGNKIEESGQEQKPKENRNIIEQYSPTLFQYLQDLIKNGSSPIEAGAKAKKFLDKKHQNIISQIEKDHKTDWSSIIQTVFGEAGKAPIQSQPQSPPQQSMQQMLQQGLQQQGGQAGPGQQALMDILNRINQRLGQ